MSDFFFIFFVVNCEKYRKTTAQLPKKGGGSPQL